MLKTVLILLAILFIFNVDRASSHLIDQKHQLICDGDCDEIYLNTKNYNLVSGLPDISISNASELIGATWSQGLVWEKSLIEKFYSLLKNHEDHFVVFDVGAQSGCFTLLAKYFPNSKWYAFEPIQEAAQELCSNLILNDVKNVAIYQIGISDHSGSYSLKLPIDSHWGLATLGAHPKRFNQYRERIVPCMSLDEFVLDQGIEKVDFIKIDTEGWEYFVLKGGQLLIKNNHPVMLIELNKVNMEQCSVNEEEIYQFLNENEYAWEFVSSEDILCIPTGK